MNLVYYNIQRLELAKLNGDEPLVIFYAAQHDIWSSEAKTEDDSKLFSA